MFAIPESHIGAPCKACLMGQTAVGGRASCIHACSHGGWASGAPWTHAATQGQPLGQTSRSVHKSTALSAVAANTLSDAFRRKSRSTETLTKGSVEARIVHEATQASECVNERRTKGIGSATHKDIPPWCHRPTGGCLDGGESGAPSRSACLFL